MRRRAAAVGVGAALSLVWAWLKRHPAARKSYRLVRSSSAVVAKTRGAKGDDPGCHTAFWKPIDVMVAGARRSG